MEERFWAKVNKTETCWLWTAGCDPSGYGQVRYEQRNVGAHRVSWVLTYGPIPDGLSVLHACDNPPCVRPDHLFLGTQLDNMRDAWAKGRKSEPPVRGNPDNRGSQNGSSRLSEAQVLAIRELVAHGAKQVDAARAYGLSSGTVSDIVNRRLWRHI